MSVLRISQNPGTGPERYRIEVNAQVPGFLASSFSREMEFALSPQDGEKIRWYLEDYLQFDEEPAPQIAARIEKLMAERGEALFRSIFEGSITSLQLWTLVEPHLSSTRIEIAAGVWEAAAIPWELIRNPNTGTYLALSAQSFVRTQREAQIALAPQGVAEKLRILLVICRPAAGEDVPFRSVAGQLVTRLSRENREAFQLDVLRPPTYEQLTRELKLAKERGKPYHIVHFDGHGVYADPKTLDDSARIVSTFVLTGPRSGPCGFLIFENPDSKSRSKFVDGFAIGGLLKDAGVPILILNACQSAFAEARSRPNDDPPADARDEISAYGSLAQAVMSAGAAGVVAMRYSVYVVTAAQFVAELYSALARGRNLGEAVAWARGNLAVQPERKVAFDARPLQDWSVPVVWEQAPLRLWPETPDAPPINITFSDVDALKPGALDPRLPQRPDVGFFGRDETLYALDRAFDRHNIVLLHAYAGSGKTATAAEFGRWYALTGGVAGPVLFTSFERHLPLARVLDKIGQIFGPRLEQSGVQWGAKDDAQRRQIALDVLAQTPLLWIWDNIEPIAGFPAGAPSDWSAGEQQELRDFLAAARDTRAKFLITSRRDEAGLLGELPRRVQAPPMPMLERLQLAGAIVEHRGKRLADMPDLTPLLHFTRGNPLTILVTVGEALSAGIDAKEKLEAFIAGLQNGEAEFEDEETEGRMKSLGASLSYGFRNAFTEDERKILALLHLFQGSVDVGALCRMGDAKADWGVEEARGLTSAGTTALLDRAAELGLLVAQGGGYYGVHPALPWYFRDLFERHFAGERRDRAHRAFVESVSSLGNDHGNLVVEGNQAALSMLAADEDNLRAAWRLGRQRGWWRCVILAMQGLRELYERTGRKPAWRRLVDVVTPDYVDPKTELSLPGCEEPWGIITGYRVELAEDARDYAKAQRLQTALANWSFERAAPALKTAPDRRDDLQRYRFSQLLTSLFQLAEIKRANGDPACADAYRQVLELSQGSGETDNQAKCAYNLGIAYLDLATLRNYDEAERWLGQSLVLRSQADATGRGKTLAVLGSVYRARFDEATAKGQSQDEGWRFLKTAADYYQQALRMFPPTDIIDLGLTYNKLGEIYRRVGQIDGALACFQEAIRNLEQGGDVFGAGAARYNAALAMQRIERLEDACAYAEAALANFRVLGDSVDAYRQQTERLIARINEAVAKQQEKTSEPPPP